MKYYMDDFVSILERSLVDSHADIRLECCKTLVTVVPHVKEFFSRSDPILDVLIATFVHNQARVRSANTEAMGYVIHYGNYKRLPDVWRLIAQRILDSHHQVRRTAYNVLCFWMTSHIDRYSYWNRLVPLFLSGLSDSFPDICGEAQRMWILVGQQYEAENREELKDQLDYETLPDNYPTDRPRPILGCRILVKRILYPVLPSVLNDLKDWQETIRIHALKLLFQMILHGESQVIISMNKVLPALAQVAKGEKAEVVREVTACCKLIGHFVEPKIYCELLVVSMDHAAQLVVLSGLLQGAKIEALLPYKDVLLENLERMSLTKQKSQQYYTLNCLLILIGLAEDNMNAFSYSIFRSCLNVDGLVADPGILKEVSSVMTALAEQMELSSTGNLWKIFAERYLKASGEFFCSEADSGTTSSEARVLHNFLLKAGLEVFLQHFDLLYPVLQANLRVESNVKLRFDVFTLLIEIVLTHYKAHPGFASSEKKLLPADIIEVCFLPNMIWKAGRAQTVMRAACCSCLAVLLDYGLVDTTRISVLKDEFIAKLTALSRDEHPETQRATMRLTRLLLERATQNIRPDDVVSVYPIFLKGLDEILEVRFESLEGLKEILRIASVKCFKASTLQTHLEEISRVLLIHMDDSNADIAENALECLKISSGMILPYVKDAMEMDKSKHTSSKYCELLEQHLKNLEALHIASGDS
ncbi:hypothetical protein RvY_00776 [Ramazzottius varieornatus]|uniref:Uncharacterized protein n=1 Tax=Ramazzottius varieornatus TaxID=947166 RepID=A0A1D1UNR9_RAMVA|nr:hypothetical protein RvY_00776 [Ramazzottius varieornatus]